MPDRARRRALRAVLLGYGCGFLAVGAAVLVAGAAALGVLFLGIRVGTRTDADLAVEPVPLLLGTAVAAALLLAGLAVAAVRLAPRPIPAGAHPPEPCRAPALPAGHAAPQRQGRSGTSGPGGQLPRRGTLGRTRPRRRSRRATRRIAAALAAVALAVVVARRLRRPRRAPRRRPAARPRPPAGKGGRPR